MPSFDSWESYFYPETYNPHIVQGIMRNLFSVRDYELLRELEYDATESRLNELRQGFF